MRPGRETVEELLARAPKAPRSDSSSFSVARKSAEPPVVDEEETDSGTLIALRTEIDAAVAGVVRKPRFAGFRAKSRFHMDETSRGYAVSVAIWRED